MLLLTSCFLFTGCCPICGETPKESAERRHKEYLEKEQAKQVADSIYKEKTKPFDYKVTYGLKSLKFDRIKETGVRGGFHGGFFLGHGSVRSYEHTYDEYYFYVVYKEGAKLVKVPVDKVYIIETDSIEPCAVKVFCNCQYYIQPETERKYYSDVAKDGYWIGEWTSRNTRQIRVTHESLNFLENKPIEWRLGNQTYIQLYVPIGTIIEEYHGYE